jgi:hypothetical protein
MVAVLGNHCTEIDDIPESLIHIQKIRGGRVPLKNLKTGLLTERSYRINQFQV